MVKGDIRRMWYGIGGERQCGRVGGGEDGMSTNAESSMRPITRITVKMVAEPRDDTAGLEDYSAVDKSCMVVAADRLSLIALSP